MTYLRPESIEELEQLLEAGASVDVPAFIDHIQNLPHTTALPLVYEKRLEQVLIDVVEQRLKSAIDTSSECMFFSRVGSELSDRFHIHKMYHNKYIQPVMAKHIDDQCLAHLKSGIANDDDIYKNVFIFNMREEFTFRFETVPAHFHQLKLDSVIHQYFPSPDCHSKKARHKRLEMDARRFQREFTDLNKAFEDGARLMDNQNNGWTEAGYIAEEAWVKVFEEYFGQQFNIHHRKPIHFDSNRLAQYDIVMTRKDYTHTSPPITDYVNAEDVVAAFEVKRTLQKEHVVLNHEGARKIFDRDCIRLKKAVMPQRRTQDTELTPYQMLRGKIFFGVLSLDVADDAMKLMISGKNHLERHLHYHYSPELLDNNEHFTDYAPDIVYCPHKLLWAKETKLLRNGFTDESVTFFVQKGENTIDKSASTFGYLTASMRRFFIGQGHIPKTDRQAYLKDYQYFELLKSGNSQSRYLLHRIEDKWPDYIPDIDSYLRTQVPNEHSGLPLSQRLPLEPFKNWTAEEAQDITKYVKGALRQITKLEIQRNLPVLPIPCQAFFLPDRFDQKRFEQEFDVAFDTLLNI